jgi:hypothetical protein
MYSLRISFVRFHWKHVLRVRRHCDLARGYCTILFDQYLPVRTICTFNITCYTTPWSDFPRRTSRVVSLFIPLRKPLRMSRKPHENMRELARLVSSPPPRGGANNLTAVLGMARLGATRGENRHFSSDRMICRFRKALVRKAFKIVYVHQRQDFLFG